MIQNDAVPVWAMSVGVVVPLVAILGVCVCGCRKTVPKSDLHGLPGMVKITNPEDTTSNQQVPDETRVNSVGNTMTYVDTSDINKRASTAVNRSLPAIPSDTERLRTGGGIIWESELNGDTGSELYATVGDKQVERENAVASPSGLQTRSIVDHELGKNKSGKLLSENQTDDSIHYDSLKSEHPYDKVKKSEHPYAQVRASNNAHSSHQIPGSHTAQESLEDSGDARPSSSGVPPPHSNPVPPPRSRRSTSGMLALVGESSGTDSSGSEVNGTTVSPSATEHINDIPAATAIAGRVAASQELPYMTPPIPSQGNFSGDSQDSKGYTSISVREPLASIKAQTKAWSQSQPLETQDSHYATVSDDSDEMYAAIEEPGHVYNSGSETYAQIQPASVIEHQAIETNAEIYPPQPPSVDSLKHVAQAHSRQASSSSATSSVANLGSPKPEKRQANSPLPPPPSGSPDISIEKQTSGPNEINVEEMYAKVIKKKRNPENDTSGVSLQSDTRYSSQTAPDFQNHSVSSHEHTQATQNTDRSSSGGCESMSEFKGDSGRVTHDAGENFQAQEQYKIQNSILYKSGERSTVGLGYIDPGYEVVHSKSSGETTSTIKMESDRASCDGKIGTNFSDSNSCNNNRNSLNNSSYSCSRDDSNDDNNNDDKAESDCYPKYESVNTGGFTNCETRSDLNLFSDDASEPNYESMPSEETEHNYAGVQGTSGSSELDPNYEMVEHDDPNYESVSYMEANSYPPYERLHNEVRDFDSDVDHGYEQGSPRPIEDHENNMGHHSHSSSTEPGYEEIGHKSSQKSARSWNETGTKLEDEMSSISSTYHSTGGPDGSGSHLQLLG